MGDGCSFMKAALGDGNVRAKPWFSTEGQNSPMKGTQRKGTELLGFTTPTVCHGFQREGPRQERHVSPAHVLEQDTQLLRVCFLPLKMRSHSLFVPACCLGWMAVKDLVTRIKQHSVQGKDATSETTAGYSKVGRAGTRTTDKIS